MRSLRLCGVGALLLLDELGGEFLATALGLLPVLPFSVALGQPCGRVGGDVGECCLEPGVEFGLLGGDGLAGFGARLAQRGGLPGLDQQLQLVAGGEQRLGGVGGGFGGGVDHLFAAFRSLQAGGEGGQRPFGLAGGGGDDFFVLPGVDRKTAGRQRGELGLPVVGEAGEVAGGLRLLFLQRGVRGFGLGLLVAQLLAFFDQLGKRLRAACSAASVAETSSAA